MSFSQSEVLNLVRTAMSLPSLELHVAHLCSKLIVQGGQLGG